MHFSLDNTKYLCYTFSNKEEKYMARMEEVFSDDGIRKLHTTKIGKGKMRLTTGTSLFYAWDAVPDCTAEQCPAFANCIYDKKDKCKVIREGLKGLSFVLFRNFREKMTEDQLWRIGMHLMPLYRMLFRLNIEELGVDRVIVEDMRGIRRINPLYKELRETIKTIDLTWKAIGISEDKKEDENDGHGDPDFVENLEKKSVARREDTKQLIRRRREEANG